MRNMGDVETEEALVESESIDDEQNDEDMSSNSSKSRGQKSVLARKNQGSAEERKKPKVPFYESITLLEGQKPREGYKFLKEPPPPLVAKLVPKESESRKTGESKLEDNQSEADTSSSKKVHLRKWRDKRRGRHHQRHTHSPLLKKPLTGQGSASKTDSGKQQTSKQTENSSLTSTSKETLERIYYRKVFSLYQFQFSAVTMVICMFTLEAMQTALKYSWGFALFLALLGVPFGFIPLILLRNCSPLREAILINYLMFFVYFLPQALTFGLLSHVTYTLFFLIFHFTGALISLFITGLSFTTVIYEHIDHNMKLIRPSFLYFEQFRIGTWVFGFVLGVFGVLSLAACTTYLVYEAREIKYFDFKHSTLLEEIIEHSLISLAIFLAFIFQMFAFFRARSHLEKHRNKVQTFTDEFYPVTDFYYKIAMLPVNTVRWMTGCHCEKTSDQMDKSTTEKTPTSGKQKTESSGKNRPFRKLT